MIDLAAAVTAARSAAGPRLRRDRRQGDVVPNGVNAIPSAVTAWLDTRRRAARAVAADVGRGGASRWRSRTPDTDSTPPW
jgi:N-carbamoyl-L-amino-acid hydrolase